MLIAPDDAFKLLFGNAPYGDVLPRLLRTVLLSIGAVVGGELFGRNVTAVKETI